MGIKKRKQDSDDEEVVDHSASDSDAQLKKKSVKPKSATTSKGKAPSKPKTVKKPKFNDSGDESPAHEESNQPAVKVLKNAEGEKYVELGKKKRAAVRPFKGQVFVDIREFYGADGDEKPGKKGISLSVEQWEALKQSISTIDSFFAEHVKK
ncbi:transcriptional Coactivator p15-domain-containing protein [Boletus edulis BED1]|uniref:Transcriptional Coactivator p15-domain-containing protein n=1 Tax=Boletus edulis BED1 TaxID=1328754 RepID=A0AAD4C026_BOLED|nr:transcriptional Coactivator p15-domain-containing protein [Boletus edulis BED1]